MTTPETTPSARKAPLSTKARHRRRLENRLKKKVFRAQQLQKRKRKPLPAIVRSTERRIENLKKKLAA